MNHCDEDSWEATEFESISQHIDCPGEVYDCYEPGLYTSGFKEWLFQRPLLWRRLLSSALRAAKQKDSYNFSALTLVRIVLFQSTENDPDYLRRFDHTDYCFVPDLSNLLNGLYQETGESLLKGEDQRSQAEQVIDIARFIEYPTMNLPAFLDSELDAMHEISEYSAYE